MFDRILKYFQDKIREQNYIMTLHAEEEMESEELTIWDVEYCILTGEIIERQKDRITSEWKYRIQGQAFDGLEIETIVKLSPTGKLVFITVYTV
jgi:hypothetical protein